MCVEGRHGLVKRRQGAWFTLACGIRNDRGGGAVLWKHQEAQGWSSAGGGVGSGGLSRRPENSTP